MLKLCAATPTTRYADLLQQNCTTAAVTKLITIEATEQLSNPYERIQHERM
jgi:hypothetical protein